MRAGRLWSGLAAALATVSVAAVIRWSGEDPSPPRAEGAAHGSAVTFRGLADGPAGGTPLAQIPHYPYDGRFTFVRIRYSSGMQRGFGRGGGPLWAHDYPVGETNFLKILAETTNLEPVMEGGNVFGLDDPELTRYPIAYLVEVGAWAPTPAEVEGLRNYLLKGGFLIIDDFRGDWELYNFREQMRRVLPGHQMIQLDVSHPIFNSFFHIESLDLAPPTFQGYRPAYLGIFEDNDPEERLMVMINFNNDIGEYWEYSDVGWYPIDLSNEAYKLGVNYMIYAFTH